MILDTSALLALLFDEPEADPFAASIAAAPIVGVGAPTLTETSIVLQSRLSVPAVPVVERLLGVAGIEIIPFDGEHWKIAHDAFARYGKGRHPAALNLGDCCAYATAARAGMPLLCKGNDFQQTDIALA